DGLDSMFWIEDCLALEHGASDGGQAVGDTPQGAAMAMTSLAQFRIAGAAAHVVLDGDAGPMVDGGAQPQMTGLTHENHAALAAAPRHRGDAGQGAQRRGRWKDYRRESLRARRSRPRRDVRLAGDDERRRAAPGRRGDRGTARSHRRDPARAPFPGRCGQPQTARPLPRSLHGRPGAKDDRRDAYVLADALRTDRHCFRRLGVEDPVVIELREWSRMAEDLQQERNRLANRVREQLWRHYPQALELGTALPLASKEWPRLR